MHFIRIDVYDLKKVYNKSNPNTQAFLLIIVFYIEFGLRVTQNCQIFKEFSDQQFSWMNYRQLSVNVQIQSSGDVP